MLVPSTPIGEDNVAPDHIKESCTSRQKTCTNWQLEARDKLRAGRPGNLLKMEFKSLINLSMWDWVWEDKEAIVSYIGEDNFLPVYRAEGEVFSADDAMSTLSMHKQLLCGFLKGPTTYLVTNIGALKESHYALVDTQVKLTSYQKD